MFSKIRNFFKLLIEIFALPRVVLTFDEGLMCNEDVKRAYHHFTKMHERYKIIRNKQIGVAFINLKSFLDGSSYLNSVNGKNSAAYYSRKCQRRGYILTEINRNDYVSEIAAIELSTPIRQGRPMSSGYGEFNSIYVSLNHYKYYGVLLDGELVAYLNLALFGDFACVSRLMGHCNHLNNGVMYFMLTESIVNLIDMEKKINYIFYDTWYGGAGGLRQFKSKLGFSPCLANWKVGYIKK